MAMDPSHRSAISAMIERFRHEPPKSRDERLSSPETHRLHEMFWWSRGGSPTSSPVSPIRKQPQHIPSPIKEQDSVSSDLSISELIRQHRRESHISASISDSFLRSSNESEASSNTSTSSSDRESPEELLARLRRRFGLDELGQSLTRARAEARIARLSAESAVSSLSRSSLVSQGTSPLLLPATAPPAPPSLTVPLPAMTSSGLPAIGSNVISSQQSATPLPTSQSTQPLSPMRQPASTAMQAAPPVTTVPVASAASIRSNETSVVAASVPTEEPVKDSGVPVSAPLVPSPQSVSLPQPLPLPSESVDNQPQPQLQSTTQLQLQPQPQPQPSQPQPQPSTPASLPQASSPLQEPASAFSAPSPASFQASAPPSLPTAPASASPTAPLSVQVPPSALHEERVVRAVSPVAAPSLGEQSVLNGLITQVVAERLFVSVPHAAGVLQAHIRLSTEFASPSQSGSLPSLSSASASTAGVTVPFVTDSEVRRSLQDVRNSSDSLATYASSVSEAASVLVQAAMSAAVAVVDHMWREGALAGGRGGVGVTNVSAASATPATERRTLEHPPQTTEVETPTGPHGATPISTPLSASPATTVSGASRSEALDMSRGQPPASAVSDSDSDCEHSTDDEFPRDEILRVLRRQVRALTREKRAVLERMRQVQQQLS